ncbi:hypothetical protein MRX96_035055 [Rhipicephalus microplus]
MAQPSFAIDIRPHSSNLARRRLRLLNITECSSANIELKGMDTIIGLETLFIDAAETNSYFAEEIEALLERNRNTLKKVYICEHSAQKHDGMKMVENLVGCESLTMKSPHNKSRMPDVEPLVRLMSVSKTLKEVTAQPILQEEISVIARALESNNTLMKLTLYVETRGSIEELFSALEVNKFLNELSLQCCVFINDSCM